MRHGVKLQFGDSVLVKRYLWGSLAVAIIPLLLVSAIYDRHGADLTDRLIVERMESEVQTTVVKIEGFIDTQSKRINNLADLPEIRTAFSEDPSQQFPEQLRGFLFLEIGDPDIYSIEFYNIEGQYLRSFPHWADHPAHIRPLPSIDGVINVSEPTLPTVGKPGWFHMHKLVKQQGESIGILALRVRLASLTEKAVSLFRAGVFEPLIFIPGGGALNVVGRPTQPGDLLAHSQAFIPGWTVALQRSGELNVEAGVRQYLLLIVALSAAAVTWLFLRISRRLARTIVPLRNGAKAITAGDLSIRVPEDGPGELGVLARAFNAMSEQLSRMIASRVDVERRAALGSLATGIAHEIRNPLATIQTTVHGLSSSERDPQRKARLEAVNDEIIRTDTIVEEFMNYARPRKPKIEVTLISEVVNSVVVLTSSAALESQVVIAVMGERSLSVLVDPGHLRQVLMNVVLNALHAMPEGGHLGLRVAKYDQYFAELTITDTGEGMSQDVLEKAQIPFFTTKKGGAGLGLGLAICAQLTQVNGGVFSIDSTAEKGTTVSITLPLVSGVNFVE